MSRRVLPLAGVVAALLFAGTTGAGAGYEVTNGLVDWEWAIVRSVNEHQVTDHAVAPDGSLIVSTGWALDGYLHHIPAWGGVITEHNRLGPDRYTVDGESQNTLELGMRQIEIRGDRLFGLDHYAEYSYKEHPYGLNSHAKLLEFDLDGRVLREHGDFWNGPLTTDPRTGDFVLQDVDDTDPFDHDLVRYDPDTGKRTVLVADSNPSADDPLEVAFSPDGARMFTLHLAATTVDVRERNGDLLYTMDLGQSMDSIVHGRPDTCFEGMLISTRFDGSVWGVRPGPNAAPAVLASAGRTAAWSYTTVAPDGNILSSRLDEVTLLACPPFTPPEPPPAPELPEDTAPVEQASGDRQVLAAGNAPGAPGAPGQPGAQPPLAGPAAPGAPQIGSVVQANVAPQVGVADAAEEQPVMSLSASRREPALDTAWMRLALGAVFVTALAAGAFALAQPQPRPVPDTQRRR